MMMVYQGNHDDPIWRFIRVTMMMVYQGNHDDGLSG